MNVRSISLLACLGLGAMLSQPAHAIATDSLIEGAKLCTRHLAQYERENGIPTHLLSAIASTESGRYHEGLKISIPWPWTINAGGKGYYFNSKAEAITAARRMRARGVQSMDVGCMQVNLVHHADAFATLEQAFDPETNIAYASTFLHTLYVEGNSWRKAAAAYHSRTPSRGKQYVSRVYNSWYNIIDKLRAARLQVPESSVAALKDMKKENGKPLRYTRVIPTSKVTKVAVGKVTSAPKVKERKVATFQTPRQRNIAVSDARPSSNDIITVSAKSVGAVDASSLSPSAGPSTLTPATINLTPMTLPVTKVMQFSHQPVKSGPNFIFND